MHLLKLAAMTTMIGAIHAMPVAYVAIVCTAGAHLMQH